MLHIYQNRFIFGDDSTISTLHIGSEFYHFILEDEVRDGEKVPGETAIPYGNYELELRTEGGFHNRYTNRFFDDPDIDHIGMIHLLDVPNFTYIQMHPGNTDDDTEGCPITGLDPKKLREGENNYRLNRGTDAYRLSYPVISKHLATGKPAIWHIDEMRAI